MSVEHFLAPYNAMTKALLQIHDNSEEMLRDIWNKFYFLHENLDPQNM